MKSVRDNLKDYYDGKGRYFNEMPYETKKKNPEAHAAYNKRYRETIDNFRQDVEKETGTCKYPQKVRDKIWSKAWEDGHAYGFSEILIHYEDLVDFVNVILTPGD